MTEPLETVGSSSSGRARLALAIWTFGLAGIACIGFAGHVGGTRVVEAPIPAVPVPAQATAAPTVARAEAGDAAPPIVFRRTFGEDGLIGGIVFADNVSGLSQADIERDGYRYFQALIAHDPRIGPPGPP